jgi:DNA-binding NarL/FixJ family response regulator
MTNDPVRTILVVQSHPLYGQAVDSVLKSAGYRTRLFTTALAAVSSLSELCPDAALVDLELLDRPGFWVLRQLNSTPRTTPAVALTGKVDESAVLNALSAGSRGYLSKNIESQVLLEKVSALLGGFEVYDPYVVSAMPFSLASRKDATKPLSTRELEVLFLMSNGVSTNEIANSLCLSRHTVRDLVQQSFKKLGVHDRAAAVAKGFRLGYLS